MPTRRLTFRRLLLHAGVWIMATALASSLAWATVSRLGGDSLDSNPRTLSQADVRRELGQLTTGSTGERPTGSDRSIATSPQSRQQQTPTTTAAPTSTTPTVEGGTSDSSPAPATSLTTPGDDPTTASSPSLASDDSAGPTGEDESQARRTWQLEGGNVGATCQGWRIRLGFATPKDSWTLQIRSSGPHRLEVTFTHDEDQSRLTASCVGGQPDGEAHEGHTAGSDD